MVMLVELVMFPSQLEERNKNVMYNSRRNHRVANNGKERFEK